MQEVYQNPLGQNWCNTYHVFGNVWKPGEIDFTVDGVITARFTSSQMQSGWTWPFDSYPESPTVTLLLGGESGAVNNSTLPQNMLVDWVRVWQ